MIYKIFQKKVNEKITGKAEKIMIKETNANRTLPTHMKLSLTFPQHDQQGTLKTIDEYIFINKKLRSASLAPFNINLKNAPSIPDTLIPSLFGGKVYSIGLQE